MPGYIVKTKNFVVQIDKDEELEHLAKVGTIQKDTKIQILPGSEWVDARTIPILRKVWGLEHTGSVPPPIEITVKTPQVPPIAPKIPQKQGNGIQPPPSADKTAPIDVKPPAPPKMPPRLATVIDSREHLAMMHAQMCARDETKCAPDNENNPIVSDSFLSVVSDIVVAAGDALDIQAIERAGESSMLFEISDVEDKAEERTQIAGPDHAGKLTDDDISVQDLDISSLDFTKKQDDGLTRNAAPCTDAPVNTPGRRPRTDIGVPNIGADTDCVDAVPVTDSSSSGRNTGLPEIGRQPAEINKIGGENDVTLSDRNTGVPENDEQKMESAERHAIFDELPPAPPKPGNGVRNFDADDTVCNGSPDDLNKIDDDSDPDIQNVTLSADQYSAVSAEETGADAKSCLREENIAQSIMTKLRQMTSDEMLEAAPDEVTYVIQSDLVRKSPDAPAAESASDKTADTGRSGSSSDNDISSIEIDLEPFETADLNPEPENGEKSESIIQPNDPHRQDRNSGGHTDTYLKPIIPQFVETDDRNEEQIRNARSENQHHIVVHSSEYMARSHSRLKLSGAQTLKEHRSYDISDAILESSIMPQLESEKISEELNTVPQNVQISDDMPFDPLATTPDADTPEFGSPEEFDDEEDDLTETLAQPAPDDFQNIRVHELKAARAAIDAAQSYARLSQAPLDNSILQCAASLVDALEQAHSRSFTAPPQHQSISRIHKNPLPREDIAGELLEHEEEFLDEPSSEIFTVRNRDSVRLSLRQYEKEHPAGGSAVQVDLSRFSDRHPGSRLNIEEVPTKKRTIRHHTADIDDYEEDSDVFKVHSCQEIRSMLNREPDSNSVGNIKTSQGASKSTLRSLFEKEDELHLYLANEIREKESEAEKDRPDDDIEEQCIADIPARSIVPAAPRNSDTLQSLTDARPVNNERAVVRTSSGASLQTAITSMPENPHKKSKTDMPVSFNSDFFKDKLIPGEEPIANFSTLYLTTHRIWNVTGSQNHIENYECFDIENVQGIALREEKHLALLIIFLIALIGLSLYYVLRTRDGYDTYIVILIIYLVLMLPLCCHLAFRTTLQITVGSTVIKSSCRINKKNRAEAMTFLGRIEAVRTERRRHIGI